MSRKLLLVFVLLAAGCGKSAAGADAGIVDVRAYAPIAPGDRWRMRVTPGEAYAHVGVSAVDARGRAVVVGTDRTTAEWIEASADGVFTVAPEGRRLVPLLVSPLRTGATTRYSVRQGDADGMCTLAILGVREHASVAGLRLSDCIRARRVCHLPAGGGLPRPTTITDEETRCPGVGLVRDVMDVDPPLPFEGLPAHRTSELASFHVRGAPRLPSGVSLADRLIILPSDVSAACGGATSASELRARATMRAEPGIAGLETPSDARETDVLLAFSLGPSPLVIEARTDDASGLPAYVGIGASARAGLLVTSTPTARAGFSAGGALVRIAPPESCSLDRATRLAPLIRSMLEPR